MTMSFDIVTDKVVCCRCGMAFGKKRGNFPVCYAGNYKGSGFLPYCKKCVDEMYESYLAKCGKAEYAIRQMCRKLDLYWNKRIFERMEYKAAVRSAMTKYLDGINNASYAGKTYDDTLTDEEKLWSFVNEEDPLNIKIREPEESQDAEVQKVKVTKKMIKFWGTAYSPEMIAQLEERYQYWISRLPEDFEIDMGTEVILKQISALDIDINNSRASGDGKNVNALISTQSNLLRDLSLKPIQRKKDENGSLNDIPFGVGIGWCEKKRPIAEPSEEFKDVDGIKRYEDTWLYGHLVKMMGKKDGRSKLYEREVERMRVSHPEYAGEDDEDLIAHVLSDADEESGDEGWQ